MKITEQIKDPIRSEMELFETLFYKSMMSKVPLLNRIAFYIVKRKGKQMRPMFVFLTAQMVAGNTSEKSYRAASVIELIHTATLVHDDVVDDSNMRRGVFSINAIWKNKIAVLVGDYLLSKGLLLCIDHGDFDLLKIISKTVREMSEGELLQIEKARKLNITEEVYYDIIRKKTSSLISSCCALGAASVNASEEELRRLELFGEYVGMAFQIKDDLFDYSESYIGKPTGIDIKERKLTLPLIRVLNNTSAEKRKWLIKTIKNHNNKKTNIQEIIAFVKQNGGLEYAILKMNEFTQKAIDILNTYPPSPYKSSLDLMIRYVVERKK